VSSVRREEPDVRVVPEEHPEADLRDPRPLQQPGEAVVPGDLTVHIDANPVVTHKSSAHVQELVGLVVGQGFKAAIKPEAWAATHCADRVVRGLVGAA